MLNFDAQRRYETLLGDFDFSLLARVVGKQNHLGAPEKLNYNAMFISLVVRIIERIPFIKDIVRRLKQDPHLR